jgi:riboflavin kinase/FMN adenylyltransferase
MLIDQLKIRHLVIGQNFAFGYHREGDVSWLKKKCPRHRVVVTAVSPRQWKKEVISSSRIRALLEQGEIEHANELLGRAYQIQGMPEPGRGVGRTLGFPTVNLAIPSEKLLPRGVFAGLVRYKQSLLPVVLNIGTRPTFFVDGTVTVEVNIIDFHGIWPLTMTTIYLCHRLRPELKFSNAHELQAQLAKDVDEARALFTRMRLPHPPNPV